MKIKGVVFCMMVFLSILVFSCSENPSEYEKAHGSMDRYQVGADAMGIIRQKEEGRGAISLTSMTENPLQLEDGYRFCIIYKVKNMYGGEEKGSRTFRYENGQLYEL